MPQPRRTPNLQELERRIEAAKRDQAAQGEAARRAAQQRAEAERRRAADAEAKSTLVLRADARCVLRIDGRELATLEAAAPHSVAVAPGQQLLECVSSEESAVKHEEILSAQAGAKTVHDIALAEAVAKARAERLAAEEKAAKAAEKQAAAEAAQRELAQARAALQQACAANPAARPVCLVDAGGGILRQPATGLEWTQADNGRNIDWRGARRYCAGKGDGWRLPDKDELHAIYDADAAPVACARSEGCKVSPLFKLTGWWYWSGTAEGSSEAWHVYLDDGIRGSSTVADAFDPRALCVRRS